MPDKDYQCQDHSGHEARLQSLETNRGESWKAIDKAHERIDGMKNWVIAGMTSLVLQLLLMLIAVAFAWMKLRGVL